MASILKPKTDREINKMTLVPVRQEYIKLRTEYDKIVAGELLLCPRCGEWLKANTSFYLNDNYITKRYPICKRCILEMVEQRNNSRDEPHETKESVQSVLRMMDKVYDDGFYEECIKGANDGVKEKNRVSPFSTYITAIQSLPNWKGKTWKDSDFGIDGNSGDATTVRKPRKEIKKIFGFGYSDSDYLYLQDQYDSWCARTQVDSKSQETYVMQICLQLLDIDKDRKIGKDVTNKLKALDTLMNSANLQPKQNVNNAATDSLCFGQMIEKWELEKPIPEPDPEFADVNNIGKLIRVFFSGWLCKALGINNSLSVEAEEYLQQYEVTKPEEQEEGTSTEIYDKLFGKDGE